MNLIEKVKEYVVSGIELPITLEDAEGEIKVSYYHYGERKVDNTLRNMKHDIVMVEYAVNGFFPQDTPSRFKYYFNVVQNDWGIISCDIRYPN